MTTTRLVLAALVTWLALAGVATNARADGGDMRIQFGVLYDTPMGDLKDGDQTTELDEAFGAQVSFEYLFTDLIGIEPALSWADSDVDVEEPGFPELKLGTIDFLTVAANVNFHVLPDSKVDLFVGPTVGYTMWGDLKSSLFGENFSADSEFVYGANVGVNVLFGESRWGFTGSIDYLVSDITLEGSAGLPELSVDPLQVKVGASFFF